MIWHLDARQLRAFHAALAVISAPLEAPSLDAWRGDVLRALAELFGADGGGFALPQHGAPPATLFNRPTAYLASYIAHQELDITQEIWAERGKPVATNTLSLCSGRRATYTDSDIYEAVYKKYDIQDALLITIDFDDRDYLEQDVRWNAGGMQLTGVLALYADRAGRASFSDGLSIFSLFSAPLVAATQTIQRLSVARRQLDRLIDRMSGAVALYSSSGALTHRNSALAVLLAADPRADGLSAAMTAMAKRLCASRSERSYDGILAAHRMLEHRIDTGARQYVLRATNVDAIIGHGASIAITVEAESAAWTDADLSARFDLTAREVDVARQISTGAPNDVVAERLGISHTPPSVIQNRY